MAFPWIFEANWESGDSSEWDSDTGTVDYPHYTDLARYPWPTAVPLSGAYCMRVTLSGGSSDATTTEGDIDIAADANRFAGFAVWFSPTFTATANDTVNLLEFQQTGGTVEATFGFKVTASTDAIQLGIGETAPTSFMAEPIYRGVWYWVDLDVDLDAGTENDGSINMYVTRVGDPAQTTASAAAVTGLDQGAVAKGVLGVQANEATTTGFILIDRFIFDDARVYPPRDRYPEEVLLTKSGHVFVGPGEISYAALINSSGTDTVLKVFDTDTADALSSPLLHLKAGVAEEVVDTDAKICVHRGAYVVLSGTNPQGMIRIARGAMSDANVRDHAR